MLSRFADRPPLVLLAGLILARLHIQHGDPDAAAEILDEVRPVVQDGPHAALSPLLEAGAAQVRLARADAGGAVAWARGVDLEALPSVFRLQTHVFSAGLAALRVLPTQILVGYGRATGDAALLGQLIPRVTAGPEHTGLGWLRLRLAILRALIADGLGDPDGATAALSEAVALAEPEGVIRPFLDAGPAIRPLLIMLHGSSDGRGVGGLLDAFGDAPAPAPAHRTDGLVEPLTIRERDVLRLLAAGRSNAGMANLLVVGESTIKTHLVHIYAKLGVHSRTQAVARAHALHLLD